MFETTQAFENIIDDSTKYHYKTSDNIHIRR